MRMVSVQRWAWFNLYYITAVILWGAFVRATGSGAGCGDHWPLCNGMVIPREPQIETIIELTHRLTSGLSLVFVVMLYIFARKASPKGHPLRSAAAWSVGFIIVEALIGAGLVLFELVAHNASLKRMFSMSAHLLNTFALISSICLCIWRATEHCPERRLAPMGQIRRLPFLLTCGVLLTLSGMTGAIAALGDTLYAGFGVLPLQAYLDGEVPIILRLRLVHPVVAILATLAVIVHQAKFWNDYEKLPNAALGWGLTIVTLVQVGLGFVNVQLMAPVWMQLVHLGMGVLLWVIFSFVSFVLLDKKLR